MEWDIKAIQEKYQRLDALDASKLTPDILLQKNNLADMINYHYGEDKLELPPVPHIIHDPTFFEDSLDIFGDKIADMCHDITYYQYVKSVSSLFLKGTRKSIDDYDEIVEGYFETFDKSLLEIYRRYKDEQRIELRPYRYKKTTVDGRCFNFKNGKSNYLSAIYKGNLKTSSVLVHEVAHARTCEMHANIVENQNYRNSVFCEALSKYHELIYADYLLSEGKRSDSLSIFGKILDSFTLVFEYKYPKLLTIKNNGLYGDRGVMEFMSACLAFKLYYIHHNDTSNIDSNLDTLEKMIGKESDYQVFKQFNLSEMRNYVDFVFKTYHERKNNKQRKIIGVSNDTSKICKHNK